MNDGFCKLRAHHGMCLAFFQGKGYSNEFTQHMAKIQEQLSHNPTVCITNQLDVICGACPNHHDGICQTQDKVAEYDRQVLDQCGLTAGTVMPYRDFQQLVNERILLMGKREEICGDCQWTALCHLTKDGK